ncbi:MAG: HlyD family efflux transporter periplasmic adaptor subunit [Proteobacteria bacterium]|nr:HlyD family efflux transporter periplasmic adaptor subunit [Pseudomonadota bacterium]
MPGYVEGQFVYVASALSGRLDTLKVVKGKAVTAGDTLFVLEHVYETEEVNSKKARLKQAKDNLENQRKGLRLEELDQIRAQIAQAAAEARLSRRELARRKKLYKENDISKEKLDQAEAAHKAKAGRKAELEAKLAQGMQGARPDIIDAASAEVEAAGSALAQAQWGLDQKMPKAAADALVFDTPHVPGDWVAAGSPVVVLLPPENIKVRFFIPETRLGAIKAGQKVTVACDGCARAFTGTVSYISPKAEYTPPVIFSDTYRSRLSYMIEAAFAVEDARLLHPGQPVRVTL